MPRIHFQQQLAALKDKLLAMAALSQQAVISSVDAYLQRDAGLCQYVRENETAINAAQREVDEMAYELLAQEQPMAIDLRFILAVIKINGDLERVGDQSMSIAIRTQELLEYPAVELPVDIASMGEYAARMVRSAIRATSWRGASRDELVNIQLSKPPVTTVLARRSSARNAACTTFSGEMRRPTCASSPATSKNPVSVDPGHSAVTRTPVPRVSAHSASVNDSTKALVAP